MRTSTEKWLFLLLAGGSEIAGCLVEKYSGLPCAAPARDEHSPVLLVGHSDAREALLKSAEWGSGDSVTLIKTRAIFWTRIGEGVNRQLCCRKSKGIFGGGKPPLCVLLQARLKTLSAEAKRVHRFVSRLWLR